MINYGLDGKKINKKFLANIWEEIKDKIIRETRKSEIEMAKLTKEKKLVSLNKIKFNQL